jgi:hypothetical protein
MTYVGAVLIVILSAIAATLASLLVDQIVSLEARRRHHDVGNQIFQLIGIMFSVLLAFVFSQVWTQYNTAKQAIMSECGALHSAAMLATALPNDQGRAINQHIFDYTQKVLTVEWHMMSKERRSMDAAKDLRAAVYTAARLRFSDPADLANRSQIITLLTQAHSQRETRTFQLDNGMPAAMWTVLICISLILVAFVVISGTEQPATMLFASSFTISIVMVLVLVRMLDYPFEGALAIGNADFVKLNSQVAAVLAGKL